METLVLIDTYNSLFRCFHAIPPLSTSTGVPVNAIFGFCKVMLKFQRELKPTHLAAVLEGQGQKWRKTIYPEYKANRSATPPEMVHQIGMIGDALAAYNVCPVSAPGFEADDVIGCLALKAQRKGMQVIICSSDKDLLQLVGPGVVVFDPLKGITLGPDQVFTKWGVAPAQVRDLLALMGDTSDNVPGVEGVGAKTAAKLLAQYGTLDQLLANVHAIKGKVGERLRLPTVRATLDLSKTLVSLRTDLTMPDNVLDALARQEPDQARLRTFLGRMEFAALMPPEWPTA